MDCFFWNINISQTLENIRIDYSLFNLFDIIPYLIHFFIGWWIIGLAGLLLVGGKKSRITDDLTNIDGDY